MVRDDAARIFGGSSAAGGEIVVPRESEDTDRRNPGIVDLDLIRLCPHGTAARHRERREQTPVERWSRRIPIATASPSRRACSASERQCTPARSRPRATLLASLLSSPPTVICPASEPV